MSKKLSSLENAEKQKITDNLEAASLTLGLDVWVPQGTNDNALKEQVGICHNCVELNYCKTEFGNVFAKCREYKFQLNGQNRIVECNSHAPRGVLALNDMFAIAYLIEPQKPETKGFITKDKRFMKKKAPGFGVRTKKIY